MPEARRTAEVQYSTSGDTPVVEVTVPHGTHIADLLKVQHTISQELLPKISPRGCSACISGAHLHFRERLENVVRMDLETGKALE